MQNRIGRISLREMLVAATASAVLVLCALQFGIFDFVDKRVDLSAKFKLRDQLGESPHLSPRLKIFSMDDITVQKLKMSDFSLGTWASVLEKISAQNPQAIIIDKVFNELRTATRPQIDRFIQRMSVLRSPVVIGSSIMNKDKVDKSRNSELRQLRDEYRLSTYGANATSWLPEPRENSAHYGPKNTLLPAFSFVGTIDKGNIHSTRVLSHLRIEGESRLVAHTGLYGSEMRLDGNALLVNGENIHISENGSITYNLMNVDSFWQGNYKMLSVFQKIFEKKALKSIEGGDTVLILPEMYSGSTDFKDTYLGEMPGGYLLASIINSTLTKKWIYHPDVQTFKVILTLGFLLGFLLSQYLPTRSFIKAGCLIIVVSLVTDYVSFLSYGRSFSSMSFNFMYLLAGLPTVYMKLRAFEKTTFKIQSALGGVVSEKEVSEVLRNPQKLKLSPTNQTLSLVFVDMVGFSLTAESRPAIEVFSQLKSIYKSIRQIVHDHGGYVDRSLGDGLLCYFGFNYGQPHYVPNEGHSSAVECAIALQRFMVRRNIEAYSDGLPIYPLRIGINTDEVCTGDLGDERKLDFTVIGNGVNFASRLEGACEHYCILVGQSTFNLLSEDEREKHGFVEKLIKVKHHDKLLTAFECNPLKNDKDQLDTALKHYADQQGKERKDNRKMMDQGCSITIKTEFGEGKLLNFSANGLAFDLTKYIAKGAMIHITFDSPDGEISRMCEGEAIFPIFAEIRWAHVVSADRVLHGVSFINLTPKQREWLYERLLNYMQVHRDGVKRTAV